uniref:cDNA FLJ51507, highly similar to Histone-lysine N-methyltransferase, H3lysine-9 specific 1 n=1 Tax=Homo sapiens TaxID=9606 RepID=B4DMP6_HUMAN|nr:unnamed protein product [Homo sapiens]
MAWISRLREHLDGPPRAFVYINEYRVGEGITLNQVAVGCECQDCLWAPTGGCCPGASLHKFAYNDQGQVRLRAGLPIYECNSRCRCGYDCPNRVVQKGIRYDLCIFRTDDGRGWGVRTLEKIRKNSFVMDPSLANYLVQKAKQRRALRRWEQELNAKRSHLGRITVENEDRLQESPFPVPAPSVGCTYKPPPTFRNSFSTSRLSVVGIHGLLRRSKG